MRLIASGTKQILGAGEEILPVVVFAAGMHAIPTAAVVIRARQGGAETAFSIRLHESGNHQGITRDPIGPPPLRILSAVRPMKWPPRTR